MYVLNEYSERVSMRKLIDYGMLISIPDQSLRHSAYALKLTVESTRNGGTDAMSTDNYYYARISTKRFKDLCREVKRGSLRAMEIVSAMYSLGFVLPKNRKLGSAWRNFSLVSESEYVEIDKAYRLLIKHARLSLSESEDGYLYDKSYYNRIRVFKDAFLFQEVPLNNVRTAIKEKALKLKCNSRVYSYAIPKGIQTLCIYVNTNNGAKLYDVLTVVSGKIISILDYVIDIKSVPTSLSRGDVKYAERTNSISKTSYGTFAVSGFLSIPAKMKPAANKFLNVASTSAIVDTLIEGSWMIRKHKTFKSKKRGIDIRNIHNPCEYLDFVATNVYGLLNNRLKPIDLCIALGQHLSSAGFLTVDSGPREKCMVLRGKAVTTTDVKETVNNTKRIANNSQYNVFAVVFRLSTTNSVNFLARIN